MKTVASAFALALAATAVPAAAKVTEVSERGFVIRYLAEVPADAGTAWDMLLKPSEWWDSKHTWSGDAANLSLDPRAGGCFCEVLRDAKSKKGAPRGGVEHMRIVYIENDRALRMVGALGPLQADAAQGTLTVQLKPVGKGTQILLEYVVGGYLRTPMDKLAPAVDGVLGEQMAGLARKLGSSADFSPSADGEGKDEAKAKGSPDKAGPEMIGR